MFRKSILTALAAASLTAAAWAHSGATGIVKERMDAMKDMGEAVKRLKPMMTGQTAYDPGAVRAAARLIERHAGREMTSKFPEGTTDHPSEALPAIWNDWPAFDTLARQLSTTARGLGLAADNGLHGAGHMMGDTGGMMGNHSGMMSGQSGMMGGGMMGGATMGGAMTADHIGQMPADGAFVMMTQVCSACHDRFRKED